MKKYFLLLSCIFFISCSNSGSNTTNPGNNSNLELSKIIVNALDYSDPVGVSEQFTAIGVYSNNSIVDLTNQVSWSTSNESVADVATTGIVTTKSVGVVNIIASFNGIVGQNTYVVESGTLTSLQISTNNLIAPIGAMRQFIATGIYTLTNGNTVSRNITLDVNWNSSNLGVASIVNTPQQINNGLATTVNSGTTIITASFKNQTANLNLTVSTATLQSLTITPNISSMPAGVVQQFTATGLYSDNSSENLTNRVVWQSSNTKVLQLNFDGISGFALSLQSGSSVISANFINIKTSTTINVTNASLVSLSISSTLNSNFKKHTLTKNIAIPAGLSTQLVATGLYSDNTTFDITKIVVWNMTNSTIGTINNSFTYSGLLETTTPGTTTITANYGNISSSVILNVSSAVLNSISISAAYQTIPINFQEQLIAVGKYSDNTTFDITSLVTWQQTTNNVVISNLYGTNGLLSSVSSGSNNISCFLGNIIGKISITVSNETLSSIIFTPSVFNANINQTTQVIAKGTYSNNSVYDITNQLNWISNDAQIATVTNTNTSKGLITAINSGVTIVSAAFPNSSIKQTITVNVNQPTYSSIIILPQSTKIGINTKQSYIGYGILSNNTRVDITNQLSWSSSNTSVASIDNLGVATGKSIGSTTITAILTLTGQSATANLTVTSATLLSISITPNTTSISAGTTTTLVARGIFSDSSSQILTNVTWTSLNTNIASVNVLGVVTGNNIGSTTITATDPSTLISGSATVIVTSATLTSIVVTPTTATVSVNQTQQYIATGYFSDSSTQNLTNTVTWISSNTGVAIFNSGINGLINTPSAGSANITATYNSITSLPVTLTVNPNAFAYIANAGANNLVGCIITSDGGIGSCYLLISSGLTSPRTVWYDSQTNKLFVLDANSVWSCTVTSSGSVPSLNSCSSTNVGVTNGLGLMFNGTASIVNQYGWYSGCGSVFGLQTCTNFMTLNGASNISLNTWINEYYIPVNNTGMFACSAPNSCQIATLNNVSPSTNLGNPYFYASGYSYIPDIGNNTIYYCQSPSASSPGTIPNCSTQSGLTGLSSPVGLTVRGYAYILNTGSNSILKCNIQGNGTLANPCTNYTGFNNPQGIVIQ